VRHRWPFAIFTASGRPRSRHIAAIPTAGPIASIQKAIRHVEPSPGSSAPTIRIATAVSRNPSASWSDSADPDVPGGESSETAAENCATPEDDAIPGSAETVD